MLTVNVDSICHLCGLTASLVGFMKGQSNLQLLHIDQRNT